MKGGIQFPPRENQVHNQIKTFPSISFGNLHSVLGMYVGNEICANLGFKNASSSIKTHCPGRVRVNFTLKETPYDLEANSIFEPMPKKGLVLIPGTDVLTLIEKSHEPESKTSAFKDAILQFFVLNDLDSCAIAPTNETAEDSPNIDTMTMKLDEVEKDLRTLISTLDVSKGKTIDQLAFGCSVPKSTLVKFLQENNFLLLNTEIPYLKWVAAGVFSDTKNQNTGEVETLITPLGMNLFIKILLERFVPKKKKESLWDKIKGVFSHE